MRTGSRSSSEKPPAENSTVQCGLVHNILDLARVPCARSNGGLELHNGSGATTRVRAHGGRKRFSFSRDFLSISSALLRARRDGSGVVMTGVHAIHPIHTAVVLREGACQQTVIGRACNIIAKGGVSRNGTPGEKKKQEERGARRLVMIRYLKQAALCWTCETLQVVVQGARKWSRGTTCFVPHSQAHPRS